MVNDHFLPEIEPYETGTLKVSEVHTLCWEQCGCPDGIPVLFVHGGPGAGCSANDRRFFDASKFRVVLFDQRGAGRSTPLGSLEENTTDLLVRDIEQLRETLDIDTWHVFGGSWGSTLGLYYAQEHPERVRSLILRGIWLFREQDIRWWLYEMGSIQPEIWRKFAGHVPASERDDLLEAYWRRFHSSDEKVALEAARTWSVYEGSCCTLRPNPEFADAFAEDRMAWGVARLEAHYIRNQRFEPESLLLDRVDRIRHIPAFAVHGRYDIVCPMRGFDDLRRAWPELDCEVVPDAGHSSHEPGITRELVAATNRVADAGSPVRRTRESSR